jgi:hypothetical protein
MEATSSSETSVHFRRTTWRYIAEDRTLQAQTPFRICKYKNVCTSWFYLAMLSVAKSIQRGMIGKLMNDEWIRMWNEAIVA